NQPEHKRSQPIRVAADCELDCRHPSAQWSVSSGRVWTALATERAQHASHTLMRLIAFLAAVSVATIRATLPQDVPPSFVGGAAEIVVLPVPVPDKRGMLVTDLPRDRFVVFDNGRRQELAFFSGEDLPVTVGLILDTSGSMAPKLPELVVATLALARSSNPDDEFFVVAFNDTVHEPRADRLGVMSDTTALESELRSLAAEGQTALYDALT